MAKVLSCATAKFEYPIMAGQLRLQGLQNEVLVSICSRSKWFDQNSTVVIFAAGGSRGFVSLYQNIVIDDFTIKRQLNLRKGATDEDCVPVNSNGLCTTINRTGREEWGIL